MLKYRVTLLALVFLLTTVMVSAVTGCSGAAMAYDNGTDNIVQIMDETVPESKPAVTAETSAEESTKETPVAELPKKSAIAVSDVQITTDTSETEPDTSEETAFMQRTLNLSYDRTREDDNRIGSEWSFIEMINGAPAENGPVTLQAGDSLEFYVEATEADTLPDIGENTVNHVVTEEDLEEGFTVELEVIVTENGGRYKGQSAVFIYKFVFYVE